MNIQDNKISNKRRINWMIQCKAALLQTKSKSRHNLSKYTAAAISVLLTVVTLASNVEASHAEFSNSASVVSQSEWDTPSGQPDYIDVVEQTYSVSLLLNPDEVESPELTKLLKAKATSIDITNFINLAAEQIGKPYIFGRTGPKSFDCSGLVYYCLNETGLSIDRTTASGFSKEKDWDKITSMDDLKPGDILFFSTGGKKVGHTGIYIGDGEMIDASSSIGEVVQRSCLTSFWVNNFVCARRPFTY